MASQFNDRHFWARGYYVVTVGNVNEETIRQYIKEQEENDKLANTTLQIWRVVQHYGKKGSENYSRSEIPSLPLFPDNPVRLFFEDPRSAYALSYSADPVGLSTGYA